MSRGFRLTRRAALVATVGGAVAAPFIQRGGLVQAAAPQRGPARPHFYRFKVGAFEVTTLLDGYIQLDGPHPIFGENQPADAVQAYASENRLPPDRMEISFTQVLVNTGDQLVLFDAGNPEARRPTAANLTAAMAAAGYDPSQVDVVVVTHMHPDHIGGLMRDGKPVFPNARLVTGETEYDFWSKPERLSGPTENAAKLVQANVVPLADKTTFIKDGAEVVPGIRAMAAFGHTPGQMAYHVESDGKRFLIFADVTNHYVMSLQRPDWHVRFDMDKEAAVATRKRVLDMLAADGIPATGYHMPFPAVGYVEKAGEGYRWVPASYQLNL
ncbi:MAG: MBL fold metallo-hydrolase [Alphaproteobacteria bacterium]